MSCKGLDLSPTQRTIKALKDQGRLCGIVERFIQNPVSHGIRSDLFNIFDIIALDPARGIIGVQCCGQDFAAHYRKITEEYGDNAIEWLLCKGRIELWGWRKLLAKPGGKLRVWRPRVKEITFSDFKGIYEPESRFEREDALQ